MRALSDGRINDTPAETDLLSEVLAAIHVEQAIVGEFSFGVPWGVEIRQMPLAISWTVVEGEMWILSHCATPMLLRRGDSILFPHGTTRLPLAFGSAPDVAVRSELDLWREAELEGFVAGSVTSQCHRVQWGGAGERSRAISLAFAFQDQSLSPLLASLPDIVVMRADEAMSDYVWAMLPLVVSDGADGDPGYSALVTQVAQGIAQILVRSHVLSQDPATTGWLAALGDAQLASAMNCMLSEPAHPWTVTELAATAGLSRSLFTLRFQQRVGESPKRFLRGWRMHLAREALAQGSVGISKIVSSLGYCSEAAFRKAFREATGHAPRDFRRDSEKHSMPSVMDEMERSLGIRARLNGSGRPAGTKGSDSNSQSARNHRTSG